MTKPLCIYHGNCADGFGAAWVFHSQADREFDFHAGVYQNEPPDVTGRDVYLVDFSYKRSIVESFLQKATRVVLIDHHKTAIEDLRPLIDGGNIEALVDIESSGAMLAWKWFRGDASPPQLLRHIEDRDLWRFNIAGTREIQANVFSYPYDFAVWGRLMETPVAELIAEGKAIERKHFKDIDELIGVVTRRMVIGGHEIPIANLPYTLTSDAGHKLASGEPFAGCYWDTPQGRVFSLRSTDAGLDVSEIAKLYGGGGHRNASGFRVSYEAAKSFELPGLMSKLRDSATNVGEIK
jgi:oligoribonuclease NrnB/cAMP/cGMP phosphodiesterase (DHH superfamily)